MNKSLLVVALAIPFVAAAEVTVKEGTIELPSYEVSAPEKSPVFDCKWSYQRARRSVYPYAMNDNITDRTSEMKSWKALYLENEWVKVCVLPEIGGRLFYAIDKTNGYDIFYRQDAIKPANVGMNGAWISGGVEWNVFHHHRISTQMPCNYRLVKNADGSATIWLGETERRHRMSWTIGITLRPGNACMEIDGRLVNCTEDSNSMLFWANVATHANPDYQIIFPQSTEFAAYHAKSSICHWPICTEPFTDVDAYTNHVDVSWWKNHTVGNSLFAFELPEDFIGGYDHGKDAGTMLVGNRHIVRGGKFWSWGPNSGWPTKILTDNAGHYVELMVGAYTDSQPDYNWSAPGETKVFKQYWYGVKGMKGIKLGDETCAINMEKTADDRLFLALNSCRTITNVTVKVLKKDVPFFEKTFNAAPDNPWSETIAVPAGSDETDFTMQTWCGREKRLRLSYTPVKHDLSKPCPPEVKAPKRPKDIESTEECYYVGLRAEQFHQSYVDANDYYEEVLRRDPLDVRANTRLGVYWRRHWDLATAEKYLRAALVRQTKDYTRVKDGEAMYNLGLVLADLGRIEEAIDCLYRAVWTYEYNSAANLKLARIYVARGDRSMALDRVNEAIDYNAHNLDARCLKASLTGAKEDLDAILAFDPLNAYALYERDGTMLSDDPEYALELALKFEANGFPGKAKEILEKADAKGAFPMVKLHLGKIDEYLKLPINADNPFRKETKDVLESLAARVSGPNASRVFYDLGCAWGNVDPLKAEAAFKRCVELDPKNAYAWRNLGYLEWKITHPTDEKLGWERFKDAFAFYRKAIELKDDEALFLEEFDHLAEEVGISVSERYRMLRSHHETVRRRSPALVSECVTAVVEGDYDYALKLMRTEYFPTFEGAKNFHDFYVDALLLKGRELEAEGDVKGAVKLYEECFTFPEAHQVFVYDIRRPRDAQVKWFLAGALERLGDTAKARTLLKEIVAIDTERSAYCYWKALAARKLGDGRTAEKIAAKLLAEGADPVDDHVDFFDYEGNRYGTTKDAINAEKAYRRGLGELLRGDVFAARENFIRVLELKNDFLWAKVMLYSILPEWRPAVKLERIGTLKASGKPDPRDDRWMIGCELQDRDFTDFDAYKEYLPGLGIRKARFQCGWAKCEKTRGVYDFAWIDKCVDFCLAHGIDPVLETDYGNTIYPGGGGIDLSGGFPHSEEALAAWDRWVDALTKHFKGRVTWWAMWNEPDIKPLHSIYGKDQSKSPSAIAAFNVRTAKIVKRNIPDAKIAGLSLNDTNPVFFGDCLKAMGDDVKLFDRFIYHGYDHVPEETYERVMKLQEVCARLAPQARMWQGENGAPSERAGDEHALSHTWWTEGTQVKWNLRRMIGDIAHGVPCCVFTICDFYHFGRGIGNYGLVRASNSKRVLGKKLAYDAVANCVTVFGPDTLLVAKQKKFAGDPRVQLWHFEKKGMPIVAFWFGTERPVPTTKVEEVALDVSQFGFKDPVWVDLGSGAVYAFPKDAKKVPMCDSPCLLAERGAIEIVKE